MAAQYKRQKKPSKKIPAPCPLSKKTKEKRIKKKQKKTGIKTNPLIFKKKQKSNIIGVGIRPKKDLSKYIKWPKFIRIQRKKKILLQRLKVPPAINQFKFVLPKKQTKDLMSFLKEYRPESKAEKKKRLYDEANNIINKTNKSEDKMKKRLFVKHGINNITKLVEKNIAKLVIIAHDVAPIEVILFLPTLCRLKGVPYCIVKNKSTLGKLVHKKKTTAICVDEVLKTDKEKLDYFCDICKEKFNDNVTIRRKWGGQKISAKSMLLKKIKDDAKKVEEAKKKKVTSKL